MGAFAYGVNLRRWPTRLLVLCRKSAARRIAMTQSAPPLSPSAQRMRRHRERSKHGSVCIRFEMAPAAVDRLIALHWLKPESRRDPYSVTVALLEFGTQALWPTEEV